MFRRNREPKLTPTTDLQQYQEGTDPKTIADAFFVDKWRKLQVEQVHPWHGPDALLVEMGCTAAAYANDRLSEILLRDNVTTDRDGNEVLPPVINDFALGLSQNADAQTGLAEKIEHSRLKPDLSRQLLNTLQPEAMLPVWPRQPSGDTFPRWQIDKDNYVTEHPVTLAFVKSVAVAARELQGSAFHYAQQLKEITIQDVPLEYTGLFDMIDGFLVEAEAKLAEIDEFIDKDSLNPELLTRVYENVHDSYVTTMWVFTAIFCPGVLGEEFEIIR